jgi:hypothetical protein
MSLVGFVGMAIGIGAKDDELDELHARLQRRPVPSRPSEVANDVRNVLFSIRMERDTQAKKERHGQQDAAQAQAPQEDLPH